MVELPDVPNTPCLGQLPPSTHTGKIVILGRECIASQITQEWSPSVSHLIVTTGPLVKVGARTCWVDGHWTHPETQEVLRFRSRVSSKLISKAEGGDIQVDPVADGRTAAVSGDFHLAVYDSADNIKFDYFCAVLKLVRTSSDWICEVCSIFTIRKVQVHELVVRLVH